MESNERDQVAIQRLKHLKALYDNDLITASDFEIRKTQIVDFLTGHDYDTIPKILRNPEQSPNHDVEKILVIGYIRFIEILLQNNTMNIIPNGVIGLCFLYYSIPNMFINDKLYHLLPDWNTNICTEKAKKWIYDYKGNKWKSMQCNIKIDEIPFAKGGIRYVFYLQDLSNPMANYVAKMSQDICYNIKKEIYFNHVKIQTIARHFCHGYNSCNPPINIDFLETFVLQLTPRYGANYCIVEIYKPSSYRKYNNNAGWIGSTERNTPQAFAHFTYEASKGKLLVCDIQRRGDVYKNPQLFSVDKCKLFSDAYRNSEIRQDGFENFLRIHRCNAICQYLKLPRIDPPQYEYRTYENAYDDHELLRETAPMLEQQENVGEDTKCRCNIL